MKVNGRQFPTRFFGKRDDFPFSTVRIPHLSSNIPSKTFYSSFGAEILQINKTMSTSDASGTGKHFLMPQ